MTTQAHLAGAGSKRQTGPAVGTVGYLALFAWSLVLVIATAARLLPLAAGLCLLAAAVAYPHAFRRIVRRRYLLMIALLALPPLFLIGEVDSRMAGIPYSSEGLLAGAQIAIRLVVVLVAVDGLTSSVDIASLAGLFERAGLRGLGFSIGVALNLLPALQSSALNAWRSLWMRGGLRRKRLRALRLLAVTILVNALGRAEEIALAAEARAYLPERSRALPVKIGRWDWLVVAACVFSLLGFLFLTAGMFG